MAQIVSRNTNIIDYILSKVKNEEQRIKTLSNKVDYLCSMISNFIDSKQNKNCSQDTENNSKHALSGLRREIALLAQQNTCRPTENASESVKPFIPSASVTCVTKNLSVKDKPIEVNR